MKTSSLSAGLLAGLFLLPVMLWNGCSQAPAPPAAEAGKAARYHCPMHPTYLSDRPGECPICHMDLEPIDKEGGASATQTAGTNVPGRTTIMVRPEKQQLIGLTTAVAAPRDLAQILRLTGVLQHDETTLARIAPRVGGWIRRLHVNVTGQAVERGQPLLTLYSPELLVTERDYLLAHRQHERTAGQADATTEQRESARHLLDAARQRLRLWGIDDQEIQALEQSGQPSDELLLRSPISGHVITKTAVEGRAFMPGETLFEIGHLDKLWVRAAVFEMDLPQMRLGQKARVIFPHDPNRAVASEVAFISPHLDPNTRRGEVRLVIDNPTGEYRPEMWASVEIETASGRRLAVPASAVIDTGIRCVTFVQRPDHHLEPREVRIGVRTEEWWEVVSGVQEGESVVTRALFLIDSESQLKAAIAAMMDEAAARTP